MDVVVLSKKTAALLGAASVVAVRFERYRRHARSLQALEAENAALRAEKHDLQQALACARQAAQQRARHSEHVNRLSLLGTMLAQVAHEINNPLTFILLNLPRISHLLSVGGELLAPSTREEILEVLGDMEEGSARIQSLTGDLKAFSAREMGPLAAVELADVVGVSLRMLAGVLPARVQLLEKHGESPRVHASRARLIQIVVNLVRNAAEAVPRDASCTVSVGTGTTAEGHAFIRVQDDGPGIAQDVRDRIFDPFFTTRADSGGTGLGLAICRDIAADLNGTIEVRSRPGSTVFEVVLPPFGAPALDDARLSNGERTP